jgi:nucleotide-binding universal stress UspA family protein
MAARTPLTAPTTIVGVDGSAGSRRAIEWATTRCRRNGDVLFAVHVLTYDHELARDLSIAGLRTWRLELEHDLSGPWTAEVRQADVVVRTEIVEHDAPASGLLAAADDPEVSMIVLGANSHGGLADRLLAATSYKVTHRAAVPVVVVPPGWRAVSAAA